MDAKKWKERFFLSLCTLFLVGGISLTTAAMCKQSIEEDREKMRQIEIARDVYKAEADKLKAVNLHLQQRVDDLEKQLK